MREYTGRTTVIMPGIMPALMNRLVNSFELEALKNMRKRERCAGGCRPITYGGHPRCLYT